MRNPEKKYPNWLYDGITDDSDSWGMCCSKETARKCAEEYYDRHMRRNNWTQAFVFFILPIMLIIAVGLLAA